MSTHHSSTDPANLADDFPSPEPRSAHLETMDMSSELANQAAAQAAIEQQQQRAAEEAASAASTSSHHLQPPSHSADTLNGQELLPDSETDLHSPVYNASRNLKRPIAGLPQRSPYHEALHSAEQLVILREAYARNPNPSKKELDMLAERTGRPWNKIREYFRQRRNKMRGLDHLERMEEPGRASGWLQITYRTAPSTSHVSQLHLYNSYKSRFDPYSSHAPLLGGQELVQLACATFPGSEMAKADDDYVLRGMKLREDQQATQESTNGESLDKRVNDLVEPLRASTWLLSTFQHQPDSLSTENITQTDLYASYAARFADLPDSTAAPQHSDEAEAELREYEAEMAAPDTSPLDENDLQSLSSALGQHEAQEIASTQPSRREERLLNPVELISLTRMTFPKCEPAVDDNGRFIIRGLERREAEEKGRNGIKPDEMFPFALASAPDPSDPNHPFTSLLKRKLALLHPDPDAATDSKRSRKAQEVLGEEERELLEGLKRFKGSSFGREVRDICVSQ